MGGTGMIKAISDNLINILPQQAGHYMSVITALLSVPCMRPAKSPSQPSFQSQYC